MTSEEEYIDKKQDDKIPFNSAGAIAENITAYFRMATIAMIQRNFYQWYIYLEAANSEAQYKFKKDERECLMKIWKGINPHQQSSYSKLKDYHAKLRDYCHDHNFFTMGESKSGPAIWRR